ncbi:Diaminopropionate ammonia-lyase [Seminavis robusta]|uniref:Diaminopropionate ammonia-lyase n=1 Tax=Seminavis robusta TaxID=568900 RepID=A0A9N8E9Q0_9STRA|nr:Diaminopropionate ammonia-lyase [Seminavis robusta]|eukprot:Sro830_g208280.1 Diaminopropionate ammonia-lyase (390) ;mRNA; r:42563-43732
MMQSIAKCHHGFMRSSTRRSSTQCRLLSSSIQVLKNTDAVARKVLASLSSIPFPSDDASNPSLLLRQCPVANQHGPTPLASAPDLARQFQVEQLYIKDERNRLGMGSFKALGAAYAIASDASKAAGRTYVTASAGNHGLSVAAGAKAFGAKSIIYLAESVAPSFATRLEQQFGATVIRQGTTYEESMQAAEHLVAQDKNHDQSMVLLSDSSWLGYSFHYPLRVMEGYLVLMHESVQQIPQPPTHLFLQAGVGGMAAACAAYARKVWGDTTRIIVVEPQEAPALLESMVAGKPVIAKGDLSCMGRLDCKEPSLIALKGLARDADYFITISEQSGQDGVECAETAGYKTTPSGAAGLAGVMEVTAQQNQRNVLGLTAESRVMIVLTEAPVS